MTRATDFNLNRQLLFSLPMFEGVGSATVKDVSKAHHPVTMVHSPVWVQLASGLWVLDFDGASDKLYSPAANCTDLNFSTEYITWAVWVYMDGFTNYPRFMSKGSPGWRFGVYSDSGGDARKPYLDMQDAVGHSKTFLCPADGAIAYTTWTLISVSRYTRLPTRVFFCVNGVNLTCTDTWGDYDPGPSARDLDICSELSDRWINGRIWNPRIWSRALSPAEHMQIFNAEREFFGV